MIYVIFEAIYIEEKFISRNNTNFEKINTLESALSSCPLILKNF